LWARPRRRLCLRARGLTALSARSGSLGSRAKKRPLGPAHTAARGCPRLRLSPGRSTHGSALRPRLRPPVGGRRAPASPSRSRGARRPHPPPLQTHRACPARCHGGAVAPVWFPLRSAFHARLRRRAMSAAARGKRGSGAVAGPAFGAHSARVSLRSKNLPIRVGLVGKAYCRGEAGMRAKRNAWGGTPPRMRGRGHGIQFCTTRFRHLVIVSVCHSVVTSASQTGA
jgi:hypothetical protein